MKNKTILFGAHNNFYKGNMHCHSTMSDGSLTPNELKKEYKEQGYSFLAITDHEHIINHSYLDDDEFITITSAEYSIKEFPEQSTLVNKRMKVCHLNLYAKKQDNDTTICYNSTLDHFSKGKIRENLSKLPEYKRIYGAEGINKLIKKANESGFFVCYNHPRWSLENYADYSGYDGLWGVEIFNYSCLREGLYDYDINVFDDFLRDGKMIYASCGDDNHLKVNQFGAFVMVNAASLTYDNIINALLNGNFYSSMGPEIYEIYTENNKVYIKCSKAKQITVSTSGRRSESRNTQNGEYLTEAVFDIFEDDGYIRLDVIDEFGKRANTQAYFINTL